MLLAQPFDPDAAKLSGTAVAVAPSIEIQPFRHLANYAASPGGRLVFREAELPENRIDWFDPTTGTSVPLLDWGPYTLIRLSPDGRRLLVARLESRGPLANVWLYELDEGAWSRLSSEPKLQYWFAWSLDGGG